MAGRCYYSVLDTWLSMSSMGLTCVWDLWYPVCMSTDIIVDMAANWVREGLLPPLEGEGQCRLYWEGSDALKGAE